MKVRVKQAMHPSSESIAMKKLRDRRRENHQCTRCGNKLPKNDKRVICQACKLYFKKKRVPHSISNEELAFIIFIKKKTSTFGEFGRRLKSLMLKNREAPIVLSKSLNVSTKTVDSWLYRGQIPREFRRKQIADYFTCEVDDIGL